MLELIVNDWKEDEEVEVGLVGDGFLATAADVVELLAGKGGLSVVYSARFKAYFITSLA